MPCPFHHCVYASIQCNEISLTKIKFTELKKRQKINMHKHPSSYTFNSREVWWNLVVYQIDRCVFQRSTSSSCTACSRSSVFLVLPYGIVGGFSISAQCKWANFASITVKLTQKQNSSTSRCNISVSYSINFIMRLFFFQAICNQTRTFTLHNFLFAYFSSHWCFFSFSHLLFSTSYLSPDRFALPLCLSICWEYKFV